MHIVHIFLIWTYFTSFSCALVPSLWTFTCLLSWITHIHMSTWIFLEKNYYYYSLPGPFSVLHIPFASQRMLLFMGNISHLSTHLISSHKLHLSFASGLLLSSFRGHFYFNLGLWVDVLVKMRHSLWD